MDKALTALLRELGKASIGACSCGTGTPDPVTHKFACRYRAIDMARVALAAAPLPPSASGERDMSQWEKARFGYFKADGSFHEMTDSDHDEWPADCRNPRWVGGHDDMQLLRAALAPSPGIDAAEQKALARLRFNNANTMPTVLSWNSIPAGTYTVYAAPPAAQPLHDCCANCMRPQAEHDGVQCPKPFTTVWHAWDYDFAPGAEYVAAQPSAAWEAEAERLADLYASACAYAEVPEATGYQLPIQTTRAALLAHLRTKP